MPVFAYAIIGIVGLVLIIVVPMTMKKIAAARGAGGDKKPEMMAALDRVGLQVTRTEGAQVRLDGQHRGRRIAMKSNGGAVRQAGKAEGPPFGGRGDGADDEWKQEQKTRKFQDQLENGPMVIRWAVVLPLESPVEVVITPDDSEGGEKLANGVYASFDEQARVGLSKPQVLQALAATKFDVITIAGNKVMCAWAPPMTEYQKVAASTEAYAQVTERAINTLCDLCDALYGPAHAAA